MAAQARELSALLAVGHGCSVLRNRAVDPSAGAGTWWLIQPERRSGDRIVVNDKSGGRMKKSWRFLVGSLCILLMTAACAGDGNEGSGGRDDGSPDGGEAGGEPFRVIAVLPLSGAVSPQGNMAKTAIEVAAEQVNEAGGILGGDVEVEFLDTASDPVKGTTALQEALARGAKPDLVIAGAVTAEVLALQPLLNRENLFSVGTSGSAQANDPKTNPNHFNLVHASDDNMSAILPEAKKNGWKKLGVFFSNDALGETNLASLREAFKGTDISLEAELFNPTDLDVSAPMARLKGKGPDAVFYSTFGASAGNVLTSRSKLGWDVPFIGDVAIVASNVAGLVGPADLKDVSLLAWKESVKLPDSARPYPERWNETHAAVKQKLGEIKTTFVFAASNHTAITVAHAAATLAKSKEPTKMAEALENYDALAKEARFEPLFMNFKSPGYSDDNHSVKTVEGDFVLVPAGPLVEGLISTGG